MRTIDELLKANGHTIWSISPSSTVKDAIKQMADRQVVVLPVVNAGKPVGAITEKDCIKKVILKGKSPEGTLVSEIMSSIEAASSPAQSVDECLALMIEKHIQALPVISNGSLVGFVSMNDLFRSILTDRNEYIYQLENYISGVSFA